MMMTIIWRDKNKGTVPQIKAMIQQKLQLSAYKSLLNTALTIEERQWAIQYNDHPDQDTMQCKYSTI